MSAAHRFSIAILALIALCVTASADPYQVGNRLAGFKAPDQHGVLVTIKPGNVRFVLFDTPGESGESAAPQDSSWFTDHHALLVVNIADLSFIKRDIARSRLEAKSFQALVLTDKSAAARFPKQQGKITVLRLNDKGVITAINYAAPGKEIQGLLPAMK